MADKFRTTLSIVFWSPDPDSAETQAEVIKDMIPEKDKDKTIQTIEYIGAGRPPDPEPPAPVPELEQQPPMGDGEPAQ